MSDLRNLNWQTTKTPKHKSPRDLHCPKGLRKLRQRCLQTIASYSAEGKVYDTPDGMYVYKDNGASVLAVAHLDVVQPGPRHFGHCKGLPDIVYNAQLDDRLGAYTILDVLPSMGVKVDTLLTEGEESCRSTAAYFWPDKPYNWLIEFDRAGEDVVLYDYETKELVDILAEFGNKVGLGTYSDISDMEHIGTVGFNWGIGSYNGHSADSHFSMSQYMAAIARFRVFFDKYKDYRFEHIPSYEGGSEDEWWGKGASNWQDEEEQEAIEWQERQELEWKERFHESYRSYD